MKKFGGLEVGAGVETGENGGIRVESKYSIESLIEPGELGGRGEAGRTKVADRDSSSSKEFCGPLEESSAQ